MKKRVFFALIALCATSVSAKDVVVHMTDLDSGKNMGTITASMNQYGTVFTPALSGVPSGLHGFHIHENSSCSPRMIKDKKVIGGAAGGHFDPKKTAMHGFPWTQNNHLGDLPALFVDTNGKASHPVLAPRVKLADLKGRAVMIHVGGDNYSDHPHPLGGGGSRLICGVVR